MVDVNRLTCALIALPTPLPPQKNAFTKVSVFIIILITFFIMIHYLPNYHHVCDHLKAYAYVCLRCNWECLISNIFLPEVMIGKQFLATLVALHFTPVSESVIHSFELA